MLVEVEVLSPPESPERDISMLEDRGGLKPDQFEPLAPTRVMPEAEAYGAEHAVRIAL